jgi:hypothetical protein
MPSTSLIESTSRRGRKSLGLAMMTRGNMRTRTCTTAETIKHTNRRHIICLSKTVPHVSVKIQYGYFKDSRSMGGSCAGRITLLKTYRVKE